MSSLETETKTHVRALEGVNAQRNALGVDVDADLDIKPGVDDAEKDDAKVAAELAISKMKKADDAKKKAEKDAKKAEAAKKKAEEEAKKAADANKKAEEEAKKAADAKKKAADAKKKAEEEAKKAADEQKIAEEIAKKKAIAEAKRKSLEQMDHMTLSVTTEYRGVCVGWVKTNDSDNAPMVMAACAKTKENTCPAVFNNRCTILRPMKTTVTEGAKIMMF